MIGVIDHLTVVCLVTWPLNGSEAAGDLVLIKISLLLLCKSCSYVNYLTFKFKISALNNRPQHEALGNKPHKLCSYSLECRTEVYCFRLNFNISKLAYCTDHYCWTCDLGPASSDSPPFHKMNFFFSGPKFNSTTLCR